MKLTIALISVIALFSGLSGNAWRFPWFCPNDDEFTVDGLWASCNVTADCAFGYYCDVEDDSGFCMRERCFSDRNCKFSGGLFCYRSDDHGYGICCEVNEYEYN